MTHEIFDLQDKLTALGQRALLDNAQKRVDAYYKRIGSAGESDVILPRKAVSYDNQGDLLFNRGHLALALTSYQSALTIREQLTARDPANPEWERDLALSYTKIGDLQRALGDLQAALRSYQQGLHIRAQLTMRDPTNSEWQRALAVNHVLPAERVV